MLPRRARALIALVIAGGVAVVAAHAPGVLGWSSIDVVAFLALAATTVVSERFQIEFNYRRENMTESITEALWVAAIVLAEPSVAVLAAGLGVLVFQAHATRTPLKVVFNVAQSMIGVAAAALVYHVAFDAPPITEPTTWLVVALALATYEGINLAIVGGVIALTEGQMGVPMSPLHWVGKLAIGILGALLWTTEPAAVLLLLIPVALTYEAYRGWLVTTRERDWMRETAREAGGIANGASLSERLEPGADGAVGELVATLNHMLDRVESAFQRERLFIRETSHELRTPITICRGYLEVLGPDPSPLELKETVAVVVDELDRMARIVEDMSTLARMEDPGSLRMQTVELERFVSDVATKASGLLDGRLRVHPPSVRRPLRVDSQRMTQALINLLKNAEDHTSDGGPIDFRVTDEAGAWRFEVSDQGGGLPPGEEQRVFRPFHTGTRSSGSGLGLAIVNGIARAHGGSAGVENRPGAGATFWVRVPQ